MDTQGQQLKEYLLKDITMKKLKTNKEIKQLWTEHNYQSLSSLDFSKHYTSTFIGEKNDLRWILRQFNLTISEVFNSKDPIVNTSLNNIDKLLRQTPKILEDGTKRILFNEVDELEFEKLHNEYTTKLKRIYTKVQNQLNIIRYQLKVKGLDGFPHDFPTPIHD